MYRIGGRRRDRYASIGGVTVGIPLLFNWVSNRIPLSGYGTVTDGQFDWGGRLPKSNGGAQRYSQNDWKPFAERKRRRVLDCETHKSSRDESRS